MVPTTTDGKKILKCRSCSYVLTFEKRYSNGYKIVSTVERKPLDKIEIIENSINTLPVVSYKCSQCGNDKAYVYEIQTRAGDEPATRIYICTKCGRRYREYQ